MKKKVMGKEALALPTLPVQEEQVTTQPKENKTSVIADMEEQISKQCKEPAKGVFPLSHKPLHCQIHKSAAAFPFLSSLF